MPSDKPLPEPTNNLRSQLAEAELRIAERNAELALLDTVTDALNNQEDIQSIYLSVGNHARQLFNSADFGIAIFSDEAGGVHFPYLVDHGHKVNVDSLPSIVYDFLAHVRATGRSLLINENMKQEGERLGTKNIAGAIPKSAAYVPVLSGNEVIGVIMLHDMAREHAFTESNVRLLSTLANSMRSALKNAHLFDRTQKLLQESIQRNAELAVINQVEQGLAAQIDLQSIYDLVGDRVREIFNAQTVMIIIYDYHHELIRTPYLFEKNIRYDMPARPLSSRMPNLEAEAKPVLYNTVAEWQADGLHQMEGTAVMQSFLGVPLATGQTVIGAINLQDEKPFAFDNSDVRLLTTLANSMSIALENARLFDETQNLLQESEQRNAELAVINSVQQGLASKLNLKEIYELVGERIRDIFDAQAVMIATYDYDRELAFLNYLYEKGERFQFSTGQSFNKLSYHLIESRQTILINENSRQFSKEFEMGIPAGEQPLSMVFVPLITNDVVSGFISLQDIDHEFAFSESDVRLLETLAASMSVALENARLFGETKRWAKEVSALAEVGRDISATLDLASVLERIARHARELLGASDCAVFLPDGNGDVMKAFVALGTIADEVRATAVRPGVGILGDVWEHGEAELINDAGGDPRAIRIAGTADQPDEKMMITPLLSGKRVTGLMAVWRLGGDPFMKANLDFLIGLARQAAIAIENARLFAEAEEARTVAEGANRSKSAFLANVSHELRTPLTSILGFAHVVQSRLDRRIYPVIPKDHHPAQQAISQIDESLEIITSEGERLTALINNVLDLEKIEAGKMEWQMDNLDLSEVLAQGIEASISLVEQKGLGLQRNIPESLPRITGDRDKLVQVIINLISNAVKFTHEGTISCTISKKGNSLQVDITDTGTGIASDDIEGVFAKFSQVGDTLTAKPRGTGLGLSISKEIIEHHGGKIWAESQIGQGSTFSFTLPAAAGDEDG